MLDWPTPPSTVLVRACFRSVRRRGRSFIPEISFRDNGNVESHSVHRGIIQYFIFSLWGRQKFDTIETSRYIGNNSLERRDMDKYIKG